jgi:hypothetical protein
MAVMERGRWTDEQLDDLAGRVDKGFVEVKGEIQNLRTEMNGRLDSVNGRFDSFQAEINSRFDAMQRTMIIGFASIVASVVGAVIAGLALG